MDLAIKTPAPIWVYNVSSGEQITIHKIFQTVCEYLGLDPNQDIPIVPVGSDDVPNVVLDPKRAESDFGWKAQIGFKEMMSGMLSWYDRHGVTDVYSHLKTITDK